MFFKKEKPEPSVFDQLAQTDNRPRFLRSEEGSRIASEFFFWMANTDWENPLKGLQKKFEDGGLAETFNKWVATGDSFSLSFRPKDVSIVLGEQTVKDIARISGVTREGEVEYQLSQIIPWAVTRLTPLHKIPSDNIAHTVVRNALRGLQR